MTPAPIDPGGSNDEPDDPNLLASGQIVRFEDARNTPDEAEFREDAYAVVTLCYINGMDAPCETLATQRIEGANAFPISYRLAGDVEEVFSQPEPERGYYLLSATVYMGAGDDLYIGDFINAAWTEIDAPTSGVQLRVDRLEPCDRPHNSTGCASRERP